MASARSANKAMADPSSDAPYYTGVVSPSVAPLVERRIFPIATDPNQGDRASEIKLLSVQRPHMRAFHFAWLSFFIAFFGWFSIPPLMPTIKSQLHLTADQVSNSNIVSVASTIAGRVIAGPLCDRYGSRVVQASLLVIGAIPVAAAAFANNYIGFMLVRFCIGLVGCSFVATAYWTSTMFTKEVVGSANALAAGWGNLGAGVTYLITPLIFDLVTINGSISDDLGWRITLVVPAIFMIIVGVSLFYYSDDCPHGNYRDLKKQHALDVSKSPVVHTDMKKAMLNVAKRPVVWILAFQYACSFGVELQVHNVLSLFYYEDFTRGGSCNPKTDPTKCRLLTQTTASLISSLFGLMCIFARAAGGYASDVASRRWGMKGRIIVQFAAFGGQAASLFLFSHVKTVSGSIPCLIIFGVFVQACTGSTYGIVPFVAPQFTGIASGIVGAGDNAGALSWGFLFKAIGKRDKSFTRLSIFVAAAAAMSALIVVDGEGSMWRNHTAMPADDSVHGSTAATEYADDSVHNGGKLGAAAAASDRA